MTSSNVSLHVRHSKLSCMKNTEGTNSGERCWDQLTVADSVFFTYKFALSPFVLHRFLTLSHN